MKNAFSHYKNHSNRFARFLDFFVNFGSHPSLCFPFEMYQNLKTKKPKMKRYCASTNSFPNACWFFWFFVKKKYRFRVENKGLEFFGHAKKAKKIQKTQTYRKNHSIWTLFFHFLGDTFQKGSIWCIYICSRVSWISKVVTTNTTRHIDFQRLYGNAPFGRNKTKFS